MGEVLLAAAGGAAGATRLSVLKRVRPDLWDRADFRAMFEAEARVAARLHHRNCIQVFDVDHQEDGRLFMAMEYVEGVTLSHAWRHLGVSAMPLPMQVWVLSEILAGLHYAHELTDYTGESLQIVHRDVTPGNVLIGFSGDVKLIDFGIAKSMSSLEETRVGTLKGKAAYLAPEQLDPKKTADRRVDIYGAGVILWSVLAGERMWGETDPVQILAQLAKGEIPPLPEADVPERLRAVCLKAIAEDREQRFSTADEMRGELLTWLDAQPTRVTASMVGQWLAPHFERERRRVQELIQRELADLTLGGEMTSPSLPSLGGLAGLSTSASVAPPGATAATELPPAPSHKPSPLATAGLAIGAVALAAAVAVMSSGAGSGEEHTRGAIDAAPEVARPGRDVHEAAASPPPEPRHLRLAVEPSDARVYLNGEPIPSENRAEYPVPHGPGHVLRIERDGYLTREEAIPAQGDFRADLRLEREVEQAPERRARAAALLARRRSAPAHTPSTAPEAPEPQEEAVAPPSPAPQPSPAPGSAPMRRSLASPYGHDAPVRMRERQLSASPY